MVEPGFGFVDILLIPLVVLIGLVVIVVRAVLFFRKWSKSLREDNAKTHALLCEIRDRLSVSEDKQK